MENRTLLSGGTWNIEQEHLMPIYFSVCHIVAT